MSGNELLVRMTMEDTNGTNIPVYPETKKDQLVDASSIIKLLLGAATTKAAREAIGAVADSELSSGDATTFAKSVINSIGEETLAALGVRYSITTNGYICFGDLFGGLILQWGVGITPGYGYRAAVTFPLSFTSGFSYMIVGCPVTDRGDTPTVVEGTVEFEGNIGRSANGCYFNVSHPFNVPFIAVGY